MYKKFLLDNGVRLVMEQMPAAKSVTVGIWVNVGSRDEAEGEEGYSHFIEHMFFKGTRTRSAAQISLEIDALGGEMNAFTGRETTTFYVKVLDRHLTQAVSLLADLFHHSRFAKKEVDKERQVVLEEIRMVEDDPEDLVHDLHLKQVMAGHPLGRPILGNPVTIRGLTRDRLLRFIREHYHPQETVIAVAGNFRVEPLRRLVDRLFGQWMAGRRPVVRRWPGSVRAGLGVRHKPLQQAHVCMGYKGLRLDDKGRYGLHALNAIVGGSVSSRLFQEVRERRGLAYSIYSCASSFSDTGVFTVYAATRPLEAARVVDVVRRTVARLVREGVDRKEIQKTRDQMKGNLMLSLESTPSRMSKLAKDELYHGRLLSLEEIESKIDSISNADVVDLARQLLDSSSLSVTAVGPVSQRGLAGQIGFG